MQFNVSQLLKESIGSTRSYTLDEAQSSHSEEDTSRVVGRVDMLRTDFAVFVDCSVNTSVICICSRCLESYQQELSFSFKEEFLPMIDINTGVVVRQDDDRDSIFTIDQNCGIIRVIGHDCDTGALVSDQRWRPLISMFRDKKN